MSLVRRPLEVKQVPAREALPQQRTQQMRANDQLRQRGKMQIPFGMSMVVCSCYSTLYFTSIISTSCHFRRSECGEQLKHKFLPEYIIFFIINLILQSDVMLGSVTVLSFLR